MRNPTATARRAPFDLPLILITTVLVLTGLFIIFDATPIAAFRDFNDKLYYFKNQLIWATLGTIGVIFLSLFDYHKLLKLSHLFFAAAIILLIAVLVPGVSNKVYGARRWISFHGFTFQPSEIAKLALILYGTTIITKFENYKIRLTDAVMVIFVPAFIATFLVLLEPDLGTALIFMAVTLALYFVGGSPLKHFIIGVPIIISAIGAAILAAPYRFSRIESFLDPTHDPQGASYQIYQILVALSTGGLFGLGLGASQSKYAFIPEVQGDAIFAIYVEEFGFIGALLIIALFVMLIFRGIKIAREAPDMAGRILATGIIALIGVQSLFNLASNVALVPLTGIPLPFISYGGSSLFVTMAGIGILINIARQS
ncbi:putative lipid II flippase FtsW [Candidatus Curtissbacteria bacterium]|nr:putative lipid II flippase FtsW [Candidatus Curtissbacteria bacterium]